MRRLVGFVVLMLVLGVHLASATTLYVDGTSGNDTTGTGATGAPWQSIQKCASTAVSGDTCMIRTGTYRETVTPSVNNLTFQPETGATVTVSGADVVPGPWTVHSGSIFKSTGMTWTMGGPHNQVFVDGQMMNIARFSNAGTDLLRHNWLTADSINPTTEGNGDTNPWSMDDSALTQPNGFWNGGEILFLATPNWGQTGHITSYTTGHVVFTNNHPSQQRLDSNHLYEYYLFNVLGALDTASEWYYDGTTLYLWTPSGDNPSGHTVEAKRRTFAFDVSGRTGTKILNIKLFAASINMSSTTADTVIDGLNAKYVWHQMTTVPDSGIGQNDTKWGAWKRGIRMDGNNNVLKNCTIFGSSHNGVYMHGTNQTIDNCTISDVMYMRNEGGFVSWMGQNPGIPEGVGGNAGCSGLTVKNSTMFNSGRSGVNSYYCDNFLITHNHMHHWGVRTWDNGCWYTSKGGTHGTVSYNICHDTEAPSYRFGIYMDAFPQNYVIHHNVVYNISFGINIGAPSSNVKVYNNTSWFHLDPYGITSPGDQTNVEVWNNLAASIDTGQLGGANLQNNIASSNPGFVDAANFNFQLTSGSIARNAGRVISGITDGFSESAPDVGAYEFGQTAWTAGATTPTTPPPDPCAGACGTPGCPACPSTDAIAWWKFDEGSGSGSTITDSTGNSHTGTLFNATRVAGKVGSGAIAFPGTAGAYINLSDAVLSDFFADHTMCLWLLQPDITLGGDASFEETVLNLSPGTGDGVRLITTSNQAVSPNGKFGVNLFKGGSGQRARTTSQVMFNNTWVHLCYVRSSGATTIYANAVVQATETVTDGYSVADGAHVLGGRDSGTAPLSGTLDDVKMWNRALTASEIQGEFSGAPITTVGSVRHKALVSQ